MSFRAILEGISAAHELNIYSIEEEVQRLGGAKVMPTLIQTMSIYQAFEYLEKVFGKEQPCGYYPFKAAVLLLPTLASYRNNLHLHDRIVSLSITAIAISSVALIYLGQAALGGATLALLAIGAMSRARLFPYFVRSGLDKGAFLIANVPSLLLGGALQKIYAAAEIGLNFLEMRESKVAKPAEASGDIPLNQVEICDYHLLDPEIPPCEPVDPLVIFHTINWANHAALLGEALINSQDWQNHLRRAPTDKNDVQIVEDGLICLHKKELRGSEPQEYETFERKLNHILSVLKDEDNGKKAEILVRLGLSTYGYSGAVIWEVDAIYAEMIGSKDPLLYALQIKRDEIFQEVIEKRFTAKIAYPVLNHRLLKPIERVVQDFFDPANKHNYYLYVNTLALDFNLTHGYGAKTDQLAMSEKIYELFLRVYNHKAVNEIKKAYNKQVIYDVARQKLNEDADVIAKLVNAGVFRLR